MRAVLLAIPILLPPLVILLPCSALYAATGTADLIPAWYYPFMIAQTLPLTPLFLLLERHRRVPAFLRTLMLLLLVNGTAARLHSTDPAVFLLFLTPSLLQGLLVRRMCLTVYLIRAEELLYLRTKRSRESVRIDYGRFMGEVFREVDISARLIEALVVAEILFFFMLASTGWRAPPGLILLLTATVGVQLLISGLLRDELREGEFRQHILRRTSYDRAVGGGSALAITAAAFVLTFILPVVSPLPIDWLEALWRGIAALLARIPIRLKFAPPPRPQSFSPELLTLIEERLLRRPLQALPIDWELIAKAVRFVVWGLILLFLARPLFDASLHAGTDPADRLRRLMRRLREFLELLSRLVSGAILFFNDLLRRRPGEDPAETHFRGYTNSALHRRPGLLRRRRLTLLTRELRRLILFARHSLNLHYSATTTPAELIGAIERELPGEAETLRDIRNLLERGFWGDSPPGFGELSRLSARVATLTGRDGRERAAGAEIDADTASGVK